MPKSKVLKKQEMRDEMDHEFDDAFSDLMMDHSPYGDGSAIADTMEKVVDAANHQMSLAFELTRLAVEESEEAMKPEAVLALFAKASKTVAENLPLKVFWEQFS